MTMDDCAGLEMSDDSKAEIMRREYWSKRNPAGCHCDLCENMMPGQAPYTREERAILRGLVKDSANGDPGEQTETA